MTPFISSSMQRAGHAFRAVARPRAPLPIPTCDCSTRRRVSPVRQLRCGRHTSFRAGYAQRTLFGVNPGHGTPDGSVSWPQPSPQRFSPAEGRLPRATKSPRLTVLRWCCGRLSDAAIPSPALGSPTRRDRRVLANRKEMTMSTIGAFTKQEDGFNGTLRTLSLNVKCKIVPISKDGNKAPDYRVLAGATDYAELSVMQSPQLPSLISRRLEEVALRIIPMLLSARV